jgi:hypothetical protein
MTEVDEMIMETTGSSENSVNLCHATRRSIPEDNNTVLSVFSLFYGARAGSVPHTTFCSLCTIFL